MAVVIQYAFNNENQWVNAGEPKLVETATEIIILGKSQNTGKYHVEVLFANEDEVPDNGLLANKAVIEIPHHFIGYPISINEQEKAI
jgi:hypothetical protein